MQVNDVKFNGNNIVEIEAELKERAFLRLALFLLGLLGLLGLAWVGLAWLGLLGLLGLAWLAWLGLAFRASQESEKPLVLLHV